MIPTLWKYWVGSYRVILSGGGTGGHIYPAIAIANNLRERYSNAEILFVGAKGKMEMQKVPEADVIVTNPTHYAVAIHYDPKFNDAPIIRAKGMRNRALKIREFGKKYDVPIVENPPVARALFAAAEEDQFIPETLYQAVAEILAYVFKMKKKKVAW